MAIQVTYIRTSRLSMRIVKNGYVHVPAPILAVCAIIETLKTALLGIKTWCAKNVILHTTLVLNELQGNCCPNTHPR